MSPDANIARVAALIGDRARAAMLEALLAGRALTAMELSRVADVTKQTASTHLKRLVAGQLVAMEAHGRHRYFRLANEDVAQLLEQMTGVAHGTQPIEHDRGPRNPALRHARVCYDHLAGEIAVAIYDALRERQAFTGNGGEIELTPTGERLFAQLDIATDTLYARRRVVCRACMDWSERRHHLAGSLGATLLTLMLERRWLSREPHSRIVRVSPQGRRSLTKEFRIEIRRPSQRGA